MNLVPSAQCPKCPGPVTFLDVMSIILPFQSIHCLSCGEMVFLKHPWRLLFLSLGIGTVVTIGALTAVAKALAPQFIIYSLALIILIVVEVLTTFLVVKQKHLVVRRQ